MEEKYYLGVPLKLADFEVKHWLFHENEWWKPVFEWEGYYEVSTLGRVKSIERKVVRSDGKIKTFKSKMLGGGVYPNGYKYVGLSRGEYQKNEMIHKLVLWAFREKNDQIGNHKDFNKQNNRLSNLELISSRENAHHYFKSKNHS